MNERPFTLIAELTYRCPLGCSYCSNPLDFAQRTAELAVADWTRVFRQAEELGVVQVHLTGGEPLVRTDLESIVAAARDAGLYVNLVTSGLPFSATRLQELVRTGVDHVQLSLQAADAQLSDRIAGRRAYADKLAALHAVQAAGAPLTLNVVLQRENLSELDELVELAERLGVTRLELAHVQYHGFALRNRTALLPSAEQIERTRSWVQKTKSALRGRLELTHVLPDYHSGRPRACMDGWARRYLVVAPDGLALPCHAAASIPSLTFENVTQRELAWIWEHSPAFTAFRGEGWMKEPCRSCERRSVDFGGCRCQAFLLTGDAAAADPACSLAPGHELVLAARKAASGDDERRYLYRGPRAPDALGTNR